MNRINKLEVYYHDARVGTMALYQNRLALFEYDNDWIADGFSIRHQVCWKLPTGFLILIMISL